jgi:hypothetical protein
MQTKTRMKAKTVVFLSDLRLWEKGNHSIFGSFKYDALRKSKIIEVCGEGRFVDSPLRDYSGLWRGKEQTRIKYCVPRASHH